MNIQDIHLDIDKRVSPADVVRIGQGDKGGTTIRATIFDNGVAADLTGMAARFEMRLPNTINYVRDINCTVSGNVITYVVDEDMVASVAGTTNVAYFDILDGDDVIYSTERFSIDVLRSAHDGAVPAQSWDNAVDELIERGEQAVSDAEQAVDDAQSAVTSANNAVSAANAAVTNANTAVTNANAAAEGANQAAASADTAASAANAAAADARSATGAANAAAASAGTAASAANAAAADARSATGAANAAAANANDKAAIAETATTLTNEATAQANNAAADATLAAAQARGAISANLRFSIDVVEIGGERRMVLADAGEQSEE